MDTDSNKDNRLDYLDSTTRFGSFGEINPITEKIIGCAYAVSNGLGTGFREKVYENALVHEMRKSGLVIGQQQPIRVMYDNVEVGYFVADIVVEGVVLVELKTVRTIEESHHPQCLNYLRATGLRVCLLFSFATLKIQIKRIVI